MFLFTRTPAANGLRRGTRQSGCIGREKLSLNGSKECAVSAQVPDVLIVVAHSPSATFEHPVNRCKVFIPGTSASVRTFCSGLPGAKRSAGGSCV